MPLTNGGPHSRVSSPRGGGSTLTTVAPMSPSIIVQKGPERMRERSSTKTSSSGITDEIMDPTNHELLTTNQGGVWPIQAACVSAGVVISQRSRWWTVCLTSHNTASVYT